MKLVYLFWKQVRKILLMWNRHSWPWLLRSRIGTDSHENSIKSRTLYAQITIGINRRNISSSGSFVKT